MLDNFCGQDMCGWTYINHIISRSLIHIASGGSVVIGTVIGLNECMQRRWLWKMQPLSLVAISILVALLIIGIREPYDVAVVGDSPVKSTIDGAMWFLGMLLAVVGIYRSTELIATAAVDYKTWRKR